MMKKVIEKVVTDGVRLEIDFGSVRNNLYFNSDAELKGFVFMLHMMTSMDAASVEISVPDQQETEKGDSQEQAAPEAEVKAAEE
jgi:hypothetical protein